MDAVGTALEDGENHDGPLTDLVEIPPIPSPRKQTDPFEINRAFAIDTLATGDKQETRYAERTEPMTQPKTERDETKRDDPLAEAESATGETGTLYADPDEDGDYDAFDDYLDDI
jgi:hypothetical protein